MNISKVQKKINKKRARRIRRVRFALARKSSLPRLSVFRSNKHIYAQIIDDKSRNTLVSSSDVVIDFLKGTKIDKAFKVGENIAQKAKKKKITKVVFDRGWYKYHGRVKALAQGAKKAGLVF